jgi:hypothetical protein
MMLSPMFLFCCYNPIIGAFQPNWPRYAGLSLLTFIVLSMYIYISGNFISDVPYSDSDEMHRFTALIVIFYFLVNVLCLMFRGVLFLLEHIDE